MGETAGEEERLRRWRLVLGGDPDGTGHALSGEDARMDRALAALYGGDAPAEGERRGDLSASAPRAARWLGDIRRYFPATVVRVMQRDAIERLDLARLLREPETLRAVEPDVHLVATVMSLSKVLPEPAREAAREVVRTVVAELERRLAQRTRAAVRGALDRTARARRPRSTAEIDWDRTIRANLRHYLPGHGTVVPARLVGYGRERRAAQREVVLCLDQSGSMAASAVYAGVFGAVLASLPALTTSMVVFGAEVVDLTHLLHDPVELLLGAQLGGGTDIGRALAYCRRLIRRPAGTVVVLISDLFDGGDREETLREVAAMTAAGTRMIALLALSDEGAPSYDHDTAAALAALGVPAFACTPDVFPELMAAAVEGRDVARWAEANAVTRR